MAKNNPGTMRMAGQEAGHPQFMVVIIWRNALNPNHIYLFILLLYWIICIFVGLHYMPSKTPLKNKKLPILKGRPLCEKKFANWTSGTGCHSFNLQITYCDSISV